LTARRTLGLLTAVPATTTNIRLDSDAFETKGLRIRELVGTEALSQLFTFRLTVVALDGAHLEADSVIGADATIVFEHEGRTVRRIHGTVDEMQDDLDVGRDIKVYRLTILPRASRLTMVATQEVTLDATVPEIIARKLAMLGLSEGADFELRLREQYPSREFVLQYRETDLAFLSRLGEHVGITFFFEENEGNDRIVFTDGTGYPELDTALDFRPRGEQRGLFELRSTTRRVPSVVVVQDYNYRTPQTDITATADVKTGLGGGIVEYGSHHKTPEEGARLARIRAEEYEASRRVFSGKSEFCELSAGTRFKLRGHERVADTQMLVVEIEHWAKQTVANHSPDSEPYVNSFRAIDASTRFRPARVTPRPVMSGLITAVVVAEPGAGSQALANLDEQGRYAVRFMFDTAGATGSRTSPPVRMLQPHAGPGYGLHLPLKPNAEVLIAFVDGDPDRPIIVGAAPNQLTPSPVSRVNPLMNVLKTASGIVIAMKDS